jgi:pimeloyl-ACP methyl ester carboxylesterase
MERKYCSTRYGKLSYLDDSSGYPLIFLHGFGGTGNTWLKSGPYLEKCIRPIFVDLLGHGHSDKPEIEYTITQQAQSVVDMLHTLEITKFSLVGNSYGGWIALKLASEMLKPDLLFPVDSAGISPALSNGSLDEMNRVINSILKVRNYNNRDALEKIMENNKKSGEKISDSNLGKIASKTTIIWGNNDNIIPVSFGHEMNEKIPESQLIIVDNAGHTPFIDKPEEFAAIINSKIKDSGLC